MMDTPRHYRTDSTVGVTKTGSGRFANRDRGTLERRREAMTFVPSNTGSNNLTHRIQVVRDIKGSQNSENAERGRTTPPGTNNITLTYGHIDDDYPRKEASIRVNKRKEEDEVGRSACDTGSIRNTVSVDTQGDSDLQSQAGEECDKNYQDDVGDGDHGGNVDSNMPTAGRNKDTNQNAQPYDEQEKKTGDESNAGTSMSPSTSDLTSGQPKADDLAFCDPRQNQVFHMLTGVQGLRRTGKFTDLTVKVGGKDFRCHKFILSCNSPFFRNLIEETDKKVAEDESTTEECRGPPTDGGDEGEKKDDKNGDNLINGSGDLPKQDSSIMDKDETNSVITLRGVHPDIFTKILDFLYCIFDNVITESTSLDLLLAADTLQLNYLSRTCANYIMDTLSPKNVFDVIGLWDSGCAKLFEPKVVRRCHEVLREHFTTLSKRDEFLALGRHHMIPLVADSMLHVDNEMLVVQALLRWVKCRPAERTADMTLMLQHIRFPLMTSQDLDKLTQVSLLKENSLAMALVEESRAYGAMDYNDRLAWPRQNCISRCLFPSRDFILWTADRDKGLHLYSIIDGQHHKVTSFAEATASGAAVNAGHFSFDSTSSVCCYGAKIFFTGGEFSTDMTWSVDTATGEVKVHAKMPRGRKFHSMVATRGCLYCLGGQDKRGYTVLDSVDAYVMEKDVWVKVGHLSVPAYNMAAVVSGGAIYLVGGADQSGQPQRLIQCFIALRSGLYSAFKIELSNMPPSLLSARAVTSGFDGLVYIVCGHGEVYRFEPERRQLSHLTTLKKLSENPRVRFGLAHVGGCLVVIGGHQLGHAMQEPIKSVCLDIASKTEVRDYSPMLPGDIINTCISVKLSSNALNLFD